MSWSSWLSSPWIIRVSSTLSYSWIRYPSRSRKSLGSAKSHLQNCRRIVWYSEYQHQLSSSCIPNLLGAPLIPLLLTLDCLPIQAPASSENVLKGNQSIDGWWTCLSYKTMPIHWVWRFTCLLFSCCWAACMYFPTCVGIDHQVDKLSIHDLSVH